MGIIKHFSSDSPSYSGPPALCSETYVIPPCMRLKDFEEKMESDYDGEIWKEIHELYQKQLLKIDKSLHDKCKRCHFRTEEE